MNTAILVELSGALADLSSDVLRSLVQVRHGEVGGGAGAIWHADGLILTNAHVVQAAEHSRRSRRSTAGHRVLTVILPDGREFPAHVLAEDAGRDLAALRIEAHDLPAAVLGDSRRLKAGDLVAAFGFPWGVSSGATTGVVIGAGAGLPELAARAPQEWIAASLHLRPGHSGGPMVDAQGRLVGINTMMNGPDVGVAVPVHVAVGFLKDALVRHI